MSCDEYVENVFSLAHFPRVSFNLHSENSATNVALGIILLLLEPVLTVGRTVTWEIYLGFELRSYRSKGSAAIIYQVTSRVSTFCLMFLKRQKLEKRNIQKGSIHLDHPLGTMVQLAERELTLNMKSWKGPMLLCHRFYTTGNDNKIPPHWIELLDPS